MSPEIFSLLKTPHRAGCRLSSSESGATHRVVYPRLVRVAAISDSVIAECVPVMCASIVKSFTIPLY
jgi:hypothetical protein